MRGGLHVLDADAARAVTAPIAVALHATADATVERGVDDARVAVGRGVGGDVGRLDVRYE